MSAEPKELQKSLSKLSLSSSTSPTVTHKKPSQPKSKVVDSWEDDSSSSETESNIPLSAQASRDYPNAPPPTPISPSSTSPYSTTNSDRFASYEETWGPGGTTVSARGDRLGGGSGDVKRPEKTDAVAKRMIAGALGVRAPKKTEEQRAYDKAIREKETKRIQQEKEDARRREEEIARAKAAAWDD